MEIGYVPLTISLQSALQDLRDADEINEKVFRIDQLCINQNGSEKGAQVAMMGEIYRNAKRMKLILLDSPASTARKRNAEWHY